MRAAVSQGATIGHPRSQWGVATGPQRPWWVGDHDR